MLRLFADPSAAATWHPSRLGTWALVWGAALEVAFLLVLSRNPARSARVRALDAILSAVLLTTALPVAWPLSYCVCLPLAFAVLSERQVLAGDRRGRWGLVAFVLGSVLACGLDNDLIGRPLASRAAFYGNQLIGVLLMLAAGWCVRARWQRADQAGELASPAAERLPGASGSCA